MSISYIHRQFLPPRVIPAHAGMTALAYGLPGIQILDSRVRGNDVELLSWYERTGPGFPRARE